MNQDERVAPRPTCATCAHWEISRAVPNRGACHGAPPTEDDTNNIGSAFVPTMEDDWCGQHPDMPAWIRDEWPKVRAGR